MECGLNGIDGLRVQSPVTEGKCKDIEHVQIQDLNIPEETAMERIGKMTIVINSHVLLQVSQVFFSRLNSEFRLVIY